MVPSSASQAVKKVGNCTNFEATDDRLRLTTKANLYQKSGSTETEIEDDIIFDKVLFLYTAYSCAVSNFQFFPFILFTYRKFLLFCFVFFNVHTYANDLIQ
jgi:hypothetical protein